MDDGGKTADVTRVGKDRPWTFPFAICLWFHNLKVLTMEAAVSKINGYIGSIT